MKYYKLALTLALAPAVLAALFIYAPEPEAHPTNQGGDSVRRMSTSDDLWVWDDHTYLDIYVNTAQNDSHGWGSLSCRWGRGSDGRCKGVTMVKNTEFGHAETVEIWDYNKPNDGYGGMWKNGPGTQDDILFNRAYWERYSTYSRTRLASHEIGHSLGFGHPPCTDAYKRHSVLVPGSCAAWINMQGSHDASDYYTRWIVQN